MIIIAHVEGSGTEATEVSVRLTMLFSLVLET